MSKIEDKKSILQDISLKKKDLLMIRIKRSSGDSEVVKNIKNTKKEIARLFTKLNDTK
ncbi:MAG: ribosomal protein L29 [Rickettsiales bacterium]|jgi:ribosomal protein L29